MNNRPEIRVSYRDIPMEEWTSDEHTHYNFTKAIETLEEVQTRFRKGDAGLYDIVRLGWATDWVGTTVKEIAWKLWQEQTDER